MHTIKITFNLLFEYQCTSGKFIRLPNRIESKKIDSVARIESNRNFFLPELEYSNMAQLMPLPLTVSCFCKIQTGFTFLVPAHSGSPGQRAVKWVCVCVCVRACVRACVCVCVFNPHSCFILFKLCFSCEIVFLFLDVDNI